MGYHDVFMIRIPVTAASRSYEVWLENGLLARAGECLRELSSDRTRLFVVTSPTVRRRWGNTLRKSLTKAGWTFDVLEMPDGEPSKRLETLEKLAERLVKLGADRTATLVALGGGVVTDVAGFLASVYMRGVDVIQIPTTVLAQVDAAIGGKTGVNLKSGKNLLGTFHQPRAVLIDPAVLSTLTDREYRAGLYEALKCGVIGDPALFHAFEEKTHELLGRDPVVVERAIGDAVQLKAAVVSSDEREGGLRQVLNLGHTIGHALEAETGYTQLLHGEAVAWGMIAAANIALSTGRLGSVAAGRITSAILGLGDLPRMKLRAANIVDRLRSDKKTRHGVVHFVLPREIGKVEIVNDVPVPVIRTAVAEIQRLAADH